MDTIYHVCVSKKGAMAQSKVLIARCAFLQLEGSSFWFAAGERMQQKSSLGLGQYRSRKCERGEHFEAPSFAGGESMQQKSSLELGQYRGRNFKMREG